LRLLVVTAGLEPSTLDPADGWMHELTARLAARGHRVTALCTRPPEPRDPPPEDPAGVTVWRPAECDVPSVLGALLAQEPDVVHVAAPGPLAAPVTSALADAPVLLDLLDWSALCPAGDLLARPSGEPCLQHHPHAPCGTCVGRSRVRAMEPLLAMARRAHRTVAHAAHVRDRVTLALQRGVSWLPVGVDATHFSPEPPPPLAPEIASLASDRTRSRVVVLGPPTLARGGPRLLDLLVSLHARRPGTELVVPGVDRDNPDLLHILLAEAKEFGVAPQLRALPRVTRADLPALLAACDVGVAPGLAPEAMGRPIVEALAVGLPVVAHPSMSSRELLEGGAAGVLASSEPMGKLADAIVSLLADSGARRALGERARLAALERHDLERVVYDTEVLYESVRAARRKRAERRPRHAAA